MPAYNIQTSDNGYIVDEGTIEGTEAEIRRYLATLFRRAVGGSKLHVEDIQKDLNGFWIGAFGYSVSATPIKK